MASLSRKSCLRCSLFLTCRDKLKGPRYQCEKFIQLKEAGSILELDGGPQEEEEEGEVLEVETNSKKKPKDVLKKARLDDDDEEDKSVDLDIGYDKEEDADFVWRAMRKAFDPQTNTVRDLKIDDSDLPLASNYYHFCTKIAGKAIKTPFARQLWIAYNLLAEYCPRCTPEKYSDINNIQVDMDSADLVKKVSLLRRGVCPKCGVHKSKLVLSGELMDYNQLVMVAGQRGGKSSFSSTLCAYHTHRMLKSPRLSTICRGIQDFTPLTGTFVALTTGRAIKLLWNPFSVLIDQSDWFTEYFKMLDYTGRKYGKEFYKKKSLFIRFFHKNLDYYPMGPMKRTLRGDTRVFGCTDELGWFPYILPNAMTQDEDENGLLEEQEEDEREMANGDEVHQALDNSLSTLRTEVYALYKQDINTIPTGLNLNISSPQSWQDKICRLLKESENPATLSLGIRLPTWDINPIYTRDHPIVTSAYAKSPRRAERDFGANPPRISENMFLKEVVRASFRGKQHHTVEYDDTNPEHTLGKLVTLIKRDKWRATVLGIDAGFNNNSFALALGSREEGLVVAHSVMELIPSKKKPIFYPAVYRDIILPLVKQCNVLYVGADRWNSINLLQQIQEDTEGRTKWVHVTLNDNDFKEYQDLMNSGNQILPKNSLPFEYIEEVQDYRKALIDKPVDHLYQQFTSVQNRHGVIIKGEGYTDDVFRALVVMSTMHFIPKVREYLIKTGGSVKDGFSHRATVMVAGRSGGMYVPTFKEQPTTDPDYY